MHNLPSPANLHAMAVALWERQHDRDPRSELYAAADATTPTEGVSDGGSGTQRATNWAAALARYEDFWRSTGNTARENTRDRTTLPATERRLGEWARYQRRFEETLCQFQRIRLDLSPAFAWDPWGARWEDNYRDCVGFVDRNGTLPLLTRHDTEQFGLARWLNRQLRLLKTGSLYEDRADLITRLLVQADRL